MPDGSRDGKEEEQNDDGNCGEGNFFWSWKRVAEIADEDGGESDGDHGDGNPGHLAQDYVVQREKRIGVSGEEPIVFEVVAGIFGGLANVDPMALEGRGEPVDGGETEAKNGGDCGAKKRGPGFVDDSPGEGDTREQVSGDDAEREVREPCAGEREGERDG
jgi:hypothetical protein